MGINKILLSILQDIIHEYNVDLEKVPIVSSDNGANTLKAVQTAGLGFLPNNLGAFFRAYRPAQVHSGVAATFPTTGAAPATLS